MSLICPVIDNAAYARWFDVAPEPPVRALPPMMIPSDTPDVRVIQMHACRVWGGAMSYLLSPRRSGRLIAPRFAAMLAAYLHTDYSTTRLGRAFKRDHSTVLRDVGVAKKMLAEGVEPFTSLFDELERTI